MNKIVNNRNKHRSASPFSRFQSGLTLIELMIAMFIGLFLLLSISSVYLSNLKTSQTRDQFSLLEDNARIALDTMSKIIEHTGYQEKVVMTADKFITAPVTNNACVVNNDARFAVFDKTKDDNSGTAFTGDRIGVVYLGSSAPMLNTVAHNTDCAGTIAPVACQIGAPANAGQDSNLSRIYNAFYIDQVGNDGKLKCIGSLTVGEQTIADNIDNMQITYGIDSDGDNMVNQYVDSNAINAGAWNSVISVQIAVLVKSDKEVKPQAEQKTYNLLGNVITAPKGAGNKDKYQRAVFSTTVFLRNI